VPKLVFPGGALIGCSAGFMNVPRIKGSHNAVRSGMLAADAIVEALAAGRSNDELTPYETGWRASAIGSDLKRVRNVKPLWSRFGTFVGVALGGLDMWLQTVFGASPFGTLSHGKTDADCLKPAQRFQPIAYPRPTAS
jgi:Dehydrogenases (flavoproteins)